MKNREKLFLKQNGKCAMCDTDLHIDKEKCFDNLYLQIDHIKPKSLGGKGEISNYRGLCKPCNSSKRNTSGDNLLKMIRRKQDDSNLEKYRVRITDDYQTENIDKETLLALREETIRKFEESIKVIDDLCQRETQ